MTLIVMKGDNGIEREISFKEETEICREEDSWEIMMKTEGKKIPLHVQDATVSRIHLRIYWSGGRLFVKDLGSKSGTWLDGRLLPGWARYKESEEVEVKSDCHIKLGSNTKFFLKKGLPTVTVGDLELLRESVQEVGMTVERGDVERFQRFNVLTQVKILEVVKALRFIEEMTREEHVVEEYNKQLDILKAYAEGFKDKFVEDLEEKIGMMSALFRPNERVPEEFKDRVRRACKNAFEFWISEFLKR